MVVIVVISGNELILGMPLRKMLKRIGPSIDPWGTQYKLDIASDMILSIFTQCVLPCKSLVNHVLSIFNLPSLFGNKS